MDKCYILVPFKDSIWTTRDSEGCVLKSNHDGAHVSILDDGRIIQWEDDYSCNCGCWDCEHELHDVCKVYSFLTQEELNKLL